MKITRIIASLTLALTAGTVGAVGASLASTDSIATVASTRPSIPMCKTEDSGGPCLWDAVRQGNGKGRSFYVTATGEVRYLERKIPVGAVKARSGRVSKIDKNGCLFLPYPDAYGFAGDPGDGEYFCAR